jgi:minor curlin subunit
MTRSKIIVAAALAVAIGSAGFAAPASAGGSIAINVTPKNAKEEQAMRTGLAIYGIVNAVKSGSIKQYGNGNAAGLAQLGSGNFGVIHQEGDGHNGTLAQNGNGNAYGIFQFGKGTDAHVTQSGNGGTGATFAFGW